MVNTGAAIMRKLSICSLHFLSLTPQLWPHNVGAQRPNLSVRFVASYRKNSPSWPARAPIWAESAGPQSNGVKWHQLPVFYR